MRFTDRKSKFIKTATKGDSVIQIWKPLGNKFVQVFAAAPILRIQSEPTCTRIYIHEDRQFCQTALPWKVFQKLAKAGGVTRRLGPASKRCLSEDQARIINLLWPDFLKKQRKRK